MREFGIRLCALTAAIALFSWAAPAAADATFTDYTVDSTFGGPAGVYIADIDGDGLNDIIGAAANDGDIAWWENDGGDPVGWAKQTVAPSFGGAIFVYCEDIDGDLDMDIVGAGSSRDQIAWWSNGGQDSIVWTKQIIQNDYTEAHEVCAFDIDRDGDQDVLGASAGLGDITWWRNDGGDPIVWTAQTIDAACPGARSARAGDLDDDGDVDVVSAALVTNEVSWYRNDGGDPIVWTEIVIANNFTASHMVRIADIDGDDDPDILGTAYGIDQIAYWENQGGDPVQWVKHIVTSALDGAVTGCPADLDDDGDIDVLGTGQIASDVIWWENQGGAPAAWRRRDIDLGFAGAWPAHADDVDGDGCTDIVAGGFNANTIKWWRNDCSAGVPHYADDDLPETMPVRVFMNSPNPFAPATTISFGLKRAAYARLVVYDTMGRRVKTLFDGAAKGRQSVEWDGRDEAGRAAGSGIYFARLTADGHSATRRMTLLR
jgi:hypothetical protein